MKERGIPLFFPVRSSLLKIQWFQEPQTVFQLDPGPGAVCLVIATYHLSPTDFSQDYWWDGWDRLFRKCVDHFVNRMPNLIYSSANAVRYGTAKAEWFLNLVR